MKTTILGVLSIAVSMMVLVGCGESGSKKWRLDNENLTEDEVASLKYVMVMRDEIAKKNAWNDLHGSGWAWILICFPEEREKCDQFKGWNKLVGSDWVDLLSEEPRFDDECDDYAGWKMMSSEDWIKLLSAQTKFMKQANKNKIFGSFSNENWKSVIESKSDVLKQKCDEFKGWEKLNAKDWSELLEKNISLIEKADLYNAWKRLSIKDWKYLISKNDEFIEIAKKHKIFDSIDNKIWLDFIAANPKMQHVAEEMEVFKNFTPMEWSNLLAEDAKYIEIFKKTSGLNKLSEANLIKLYVLQPSLRNEIFSLNKIDVDLAKSIENLYRRFGDNGEHLTGENLVVLVKIFPELKETINAETFRRYNLDSWINVLGGDNGLYETIANKFAYLIPWKNFTFSDWVKMLDKNDDLKGMFSRYVNIKELSYPQIKKALLTGSAAFEKYDFWKEFTKEQYVLLIKDDGAAEIGLGAIAESFSGRRIRSSNDLKQASDDIENLEKNIMEKLVFGGDSKGVSEDLKKLSDNVSKKIIYDDKFIISKARQYGIFQKLTEEQWNFLFHNLSEKKDEKQTLLIREYLLLKKQFPSTTQKLVGSNNFIVISENKLWDKLSPKQWNDFICNTAKKLENSYERKEEILKQYQEIISYFDSLNVMEKFSEKEALYCLEHGLYVVESHKLNEVQSSIMENIRDKRFWNKISKDVWMRYMSEHGKFDLFYVEKSGVKNWDKEDTLKFLEMCFQKKKCGCVGFIKTSLFAESEKARIKNIFGALRKRDKFSKDFNFHSEKWMSKLKCKQCRMDFDEIDYNDNSFSANEMCPANSFDNRHIWTFSIDNPSQKISNVPRDVVSTDNKMKNLNNKPLQRKGNNIPSPRGSDDLKRKIIDVGIGNFIRR